jgi:ketosteroid isomerase-like protein
MRGAAGRRLPRNLMDASANQALLDRYFAAFAARDGAAMGDCYATDATFQDAVFELEGADIAAMWRMLCSRGTDLRISSSNRIAGAQIGSADWEARYAFSATGRPVHNVVHSEFHFRDGRIVSQVDRFDFWRWSRQALGLPGLLLGWTPFLRRKVRSNAEKALRLYLEAERSRR